MEFIDVITERYSVRGYLDKEVEKEKLEYVLKAATIAPTRMNCLKFTVQNGLLKLLTYCASLQSRIRHGQDHGT